MDSMSKALKTVEQLLRLTIYFHDLKHLLTATNRISGLLHNRLRSARKSCLLDKHIIDISRLLVLLAAFVCLSNNLKL